MGKLTDLLKNPKTTTQPVTETPKEIITEKKVRATVSPKTPSVEFDISEEDLEKVRASVVEIDTADKTREQIVIGMFGSIKNPKTGKRFVIPNLDFSSENYIYEYAEMMRTLVNRPEDFKKIMRWE